MAKQLNWGIVGTGNIAGQFAAGCAAAHSSRVIAVASRTQTSADQFAKQHHIATAYGSYQSLLLDAQVDAIYLSLPNSMHHDWTIQALEAGKHVLCEKPLATNLAQAQEMFDVANRAGLKLVEAFMYLSHPQTAEVLRTISSGAIGDVKLVRTGFCYKTNKLDGNIRFNRELAGGALMDVGCYCLNFTQLIANADPVAVHAVGSINSAGVDELTAGTLHFSNGIAATFSCGMRVQADNTAYVCGTEGYLEIPWPWKPKAQASFVVAKNIPPRQDGGAIISEPPRRVIEVAADRPLYALEADDFAATVLDGSTPRVPEKMTLQNMRLLDQIRSQIGVHFNGDAA